MSDFPGLKKETVLVTGATGLVGSRLIPRLLALGLQVRAIVRKGKEAPSGATAMEADLLERDSLSQAVQDVSAIVHLAAVFRTPDEELIWKSNLQGTANLIEAAEAYAPGTRLIMTSTAHVYDIDSPRPGNEEDAVNPEPAYPASKVAAERALQKSRLNWSILRLPFVYGDQDGHLEKLPAHIKQAGWHPAHKMSVLHHRDLATAIAMALRGTVDKRIVNICDDASLSVFELARVVGENLESGAEPLVNPWHLHIDGSLARCLGFKPLVRTVYQAVEENLL